MAVRAKKKLRRQIIENFTSIQILLNPGLFHIMEPFNFPIILALVILLQPAELKGPIHTNHPITHQKGQDCAFA